MKRKVKEIMSNKVVVASTEHKFSQVLEFFANFSIHHIPVVENDEVIGIISARDVIQKMYKNFLTHDLTIDIQELDREINISDLMTESPITVEPNDELSKVAEIFSQHSFHCLPVQEDGHVKGILTTKDLAKAFIK